MQSTLKGPLPVFVAYLLLLAAAYADVSDGAIVGTPASSEDGPWPLGHWLGAVFESEDASDATSTAVAVIVFAAAAAMWFALLFMWTGNRIVSFLAGALWCVHPAFRDVVLGGGDALLQFLPAAGIALTLLFRERAWAETRQGRSGQAFEVAAVVAGLVAMASGPSGLAVGLLVLLVDVVFHHGHQRPGAAPDPTRAVLPVVAVIWAVALAFQRPDALPGDPVSRLPAVLLLDLEGVLAVALMAGLVAVAGGGIAIGYRSLGTAPKWIVLYAGFGATWYLACEAAAALGGRSGQVAAMAGLTVLLPAVVWRYLLVLMPEPDAAPRVAPPPTLDPELLRAGLPPFPELPELAPVAVTPASHVGRPSSAVPFPSVPEVRESVEAAVEAAVAAAAPPAASPSRAPGRRYAEEWDRYAKEWEEKQAARAAKVLGEEWSDRDLDRNLFVNYCRPYLSTHSRVLEIGQGGGKFTRLIAPEVAHVVCFDVAREMLERSRRDLQGLTNVSYVLGDGRGLAPLTTGSIDFAFSYDVFVHLDQEDIFLYLQDLRRVLRPGGRAVVSFANLLDPLGFSQFQAEAQRHRTGARAAGRINFLSPDVVRTLATSAELDVESIHLAANNRDMITILGRPTA